MYHRYKMGHITFILHGYELLSRDLTIHRYGSIHFLVINDLIIIDDIHLARSVTFSIQYFSEKSQCLMERLTQSTTNLLLFLWQHWHICFNTSCRLEFGCGVLSGEKVEEYMSFVKAMSRETVANLCNLKCHALMLIMMTSKKPLSLWLTAHSWLQCFVCSFFLNGQKQKRKRRQILL